MQITLPVLESHLRSLKLLAFHLLCRGFILVAVGAVAVANVPAADWPQYMHDAAHTADCREERLTLPLHLAACVTLDDAILTSPAVVGNGHILADVLQVQPDQRGDIGFVFNNQGMSGH